jgi:hypothetical protein
MGSASVVGELRVSFPDRNHLMLYSPKTGKTFELKRIQS